MVLVYVLTVLNVIALAGLIASVIKIINGIKKNQNK